MYCAFRQFPDQPGLYCTKEQFSALGTFSCFRNIIEDPADLCSGEISIKYKAGFLTELFCQSFSFKESQNSAVRRHCQTIAWQIGSPVFLSHTIVVSRWFVIPIAAISEGSAPMMFIASTATPSMLAQISSASCSTQPGFGKCCVNSLCVTLQISPFY